MPFKEKEHTADVLIEVLGSNLEELFSDAATAMSEIMFGTTEDRGIIQSFSLVAEDYEALLHDFLSEILYIVDTESFVPATISVEIEGTSLHATIHGEPFDPDRHRGGMEIKGVSYSGLQIIKKEEGYMVDILFDV